MTQRSSIACYSIELVSQRAPGSYCTLDTPHVPWQVPPVARSGRRRVPISIASSPRWGSLRAAARGHYTEVCTFPQPTAPTTGTA